MAKALAIHCEGCVVEAGKKYTNLGILSLGRRVFEKSPIEGSATAATTLDRVKAGQFVYGRFFAFEGAYGFVPERLDGYYFSNEFPVFEVDQTITSGSLLATYFRSKEVWERLGRGSRGLGNRRQRVHPVSVLTLEV